jgi:hypothetical protein
VTTPGAAYLVFGQADLAGLSGPIDLSTIDDPACNPCGVVFLGEAAGDRAGRAVSSAGDFSGDGITDLMIGAPGADPLGRERAGAVYVVYGGSDIDGPGSLALADVGVTILGVQLWGEYDDDQVGSSLSDWKDLTFDGRDDILFGAPFADVGSGEGVCTVLSNAGIAYALMGKDPAPVGILDLRTIISDPAHSAKLFIGAELNAQVGYSVWGRGDVTGDGEKDVLIGAPGATFLSNQGAGIAFVIPSLKDDDPIKGTDSEQIPQTPTGGGTKGVNCVGLRPLGDTDNNVVLDKKGVLAGGEGVGDLAGYSVATAGDLNGDGIEEVLIGAPGHDAAPVAVAGPQAVGGTLADAGRVYVLFGQRARTPGEVALADTGATLPGVVIEGEVASGRLGEALSGEGDLDDSGTADLILGAPGDETSPPNAGSVFITELIVASEARNLEMSMTPPATLEWDRTPGATGYAVFRGTLSDLSVNGGVTTAGKCIVNPPGAVVGDADSDERPDFVDASTPSVGAGFWYDVAGTNRFGMGPLGEASNGQARANDSPTSCPP